MTSSSLLSPCLAYHWHLRWLCACLLTSPRWCGDVCIYLLVALCRPHSGRPTSPCRESMRPAQWDTQPQVRLCALHVHEERLGNIFREPRKIGSHPGLNQGPLTLAVSALPPELWLLGDSQPSQFSISLCMCRQNPARDRPVTPLHQYSTCSAHN